MTVLWRDLLEALVALRERELVAGAEREILDDFLSYVEDNFPELGPYRTLRLAHANLFRLTRRLRQLLGEAVGREALLDPHGPHFRMPARSLLGANACLRVRDEGTIELVVYPADTLTQARIFYQNPMAIRGLLSLRDSPDWHAGPNFHFGYSERGFCWTGNQRDLGEYVELWRRRITSERTLPREEWDSYWSWLEQEQIACPEDRIEFDRHFPNTQRQWASPRPGLWLARRWKLAEAEMLDARGQFCDRVRDALDTALTTFGEPKLPAAQA